MLKVTNLYGCDDGAGGPLASLLEIDDFAILLDCGWDQKFDVKMLKPLQKAAPRIRAVLLSHPDLQHLGALPYARAHFDLKAPIYATLPVCKMGNMFCYDLIQSRQMGEEFEFLTLDSVDETFNDIRLLRYSEKCEIVPGISVTPYCAGHMIGGTIWKINSEPMEEIIYAVDYNHAAERHLNAAAWKSLQARPGLVITDAAPTAASSSKKAREAALIDRIMSTTSNGGDVLIPVDTAGRVLELLLLLEQHWKSKNLMGVSLAFVSCMSWNTIEFTKSQLEWLSDEIPRNFETQHDNSFAFKYVNLCQNVQRIADLPHPRVVLASTPDLDISAAQTLFLEMAENPKNLILFTQLARPGSVAFMLQKQPPPRQLQMKHHKRVPLEGKELKIHQENQRRLKEREDHKKRKTEEKAEEIGLDGMDLDTAPQRTGTYNFAKGRFAMYDHKERHVVFDQYGEIIDTSIYLKDEDSSTGIIQSTTAAVKVDQEAEIPTKCIATPKNVSIESSIFFVEFEGRSDGQSMRNIIRDINPRKLLFIHGTPDAKRQLKEFAEKNLKTEVYIASVDQPIELATDSTAYKVLMSNEFFQSLSFVQCGEHSVAYFDAVLSANVPQAAAIEAHKDDAGNNAMFMLHPRAPLGHQSIVLGEVQLSELRTLLIKNGFKAEFIDGIIVVNDSVFIKKLGPQNLGIDGALSDDLFRVREFVLAQHKII